MIKSKMCTQQKADEYVQVQADEGCMRIIGRISSEAISDHLAAEGRADEQHRISLVEQNLSLLGRRLESKYCNGLHEAFVDALGFSYAATRLVIIRSNDFGEPGAARSASASSVGD